MRDGDNEERAPAFCRLLQLSALSTCCCCDASAALAPPPRRPQHMPSSSWLFLGGGLMSSSQGDIGVESMMIRSKKR